MRKIRDLVRRILGIAPLALAFVAPGCFLDDDPVAPPLPEPCSLTLTCTPIAGAGDFYYCAVGGTSQAWTFTRNGTPQSVEFGGVAAATVGDLVQACAPGCGCTIDQKLR